MNLGYKSVAHYLIQTRRKPANCNSDSEIKTAVPDSTEAVKENEHEIIIISDVQGDESSGINDGETKGKRRHQVKRKKGEGHASNLFFPGSIGTRFRRRI